MSYRANADALGESVISLDVVVQLCDGSLPQVSAVVSFIHVHDGYRKRKAHAMKKNPHPVQPDSLAVAGCTPTHTTTD